jgi:FKBP-type peptidyl-prolyl cis-trans isomerase SlyD
MQISSGSWVSLSYRLFDSTGEPIEDGQRELTYLHGGFGEVFAEIETAIEGLRAGDRISVKLEPHQSFGDYDAELIRLIQRDRLPEQLEPGMTFGVAAIGDDDDDDPDRLYVVTDITDSVVVVDGNHPLAGMALRFDLEVSSVRAASADEIARAARLRDEANRADQAGLRRDPRTLQ